MPIRRHDLDDRPPRGTRRLEPVPDRPRPLAISARSLRRLAPSTAQEWARWLPAQVLARIAARWQAAQARRAV
jgi:hypothetical protein